MREKIEKEEAKRQKGKVVIVRERWHIR